ncbi:replicase, partial [Vibrio parahaemolyticus]|uniref:primase C-terminal domain-containing protein n=1 Tax=Vibrio parahaemolyticus TaxID=670 RepID=UPI0011738EB1
NQKRLPDYGLGRNCNLFEYLSTWSYKAIRQGWPDYEQWFEACFTRAMGYNKQQFKQPLPENEVKHTAKSVAKWTHKHFSPSAFSAWQAKQGAKGGKISKRKPVENSEQTD